MHCSPGWHMPTKCFLHNASHSNMMVLACNVYLEKERYGQHHNSEKHTHAGMTKS